MSNKRNSILPTIDRSGPKPPVNFASSLTISANAILVGTHSIVVQSESVIHPRARLDSALGSILIGRRCIVHERANVGVSPADLDNTQPGGVTLGDYVIIEAGCVVEAGGTQIGDGTTIQVGSSIGSGAQIGKGCTISPRSIIAPGETLPDFTVVYSNGMRRTDKRGVAHMRKSAVVKQITVIRKMVVSNPEKFQ